MREREIDSEFLINENAPSISLRELAAPLFRRKRVLIATFLIVLTLVLLAVITAPPKFTSHMAVLVKRERVDPLVSTQATSQVLSTGTPVSQEEINSEAELMKSRDVLEKVVLANGLQNAHGSSFLRMFRSPRNESDRVALAVRSLAKNIKVNAGIKTNLIEVSYTSSDPRLSYAVLHSLANFYMAKHLAIHSPVGSYDFFAQQTQNYQKAMENSEARLRSFQKQQGAAAPDLERADMAQQVTNANGQMYLAKEAIAADLQRIRSDQQQMKNIPRRSVTVQSTSEADKLLEYLQPALLAAQAKRDQLAMKYAPSYPLVQEADQEVAAAKAAIAKAEKTRYVTKETDRDPIFELLQEDAAKAETDLAAQRANLAAIRHSIQSLQTQMVDLDQKSLTQQDLQRDMKANEANYLLYLSKREQERTSDALDKTGIANVAIAVPPYVPALPAHGFFMMILFAPFFAAVVAIAMAYLVDYFDPSFHSPTQVIDMLGIPVVVSVPKGTA